jgi:hypothetical protein
LLGTPGIGKSSAALYFLWRCLNEEEARRPSIIIYRPQGRDPVFIVFERERVYVTKAETVAQLPYTDKVLQVYDGAEPPSMPSRRRTWLVSSPRKEVWGDWQKQTGARQWYMPTFTLEELRRCREVAFPSVAIDVMEKLFERWGGSARLVLRDADAAAQRRLLAAADSAARHSDLTAAISTVAAAEGGGANEYGSSPHLLFHLRVEADFSAGHTVFASDFCRDIVIAMLASKGQEAVKAFLAAAESSLAFGSLRGHLFERLALSALFSQEKAWEMFSLDRRGSVTEELGRRPAFVFSRMPELLTAWAENPTAVGRPRNLNWPTWDAVTRDAACTTFWQITVSSPGAHGIKAAGLARAADIVSPDQRVRFVFVVLSTPEHPVAICDPVPIKGSAPAWAAHMAQYILPLQLDEIALARAADDASNDVRAEEMEIRGDAPSTGPLSGHKRRRLEWDEDDAEQVEEDADLSSLPPAEGGHEV